MAGSTDTLFGPISKQYCWYFYILSVIGLVSLFLLVLITVFYGITQKKGFGFYLTVIPVAIVYGMAYLQNRLLFNMCTSSL